MPQGLASGAHRSSMRLLRPLEWLIFLRARAVRSMIAVSRSEGGDSDEPGQAMHHLMGILLQRGSCVLGVFPPAAHELCYGQTQVRSLPRRRDTIGRKNKGRRVNNTKRVLVKNKRLDQNRDQDLVNYAVRSTIPHHGRCFQATKFPSLRPPFEAKGAQAFLEPDTVLTAKRILPFRPCGLSAHVVRSTITLTTLSCIHFQRASMPGDVRNSEYRLETARWTCGHVGSLGKRLSGFQHPTPKRTSRPSESPGHAIQWKTCGILLTHADAKSFLPASSAYATIVQQESHLFIDY